MGQQLKARSVLVSLFASGLFLGGCQQEVSDVPWSTKNQTAVATGSGSMGAVPAQNMRDAALGILEMAASSDHPQLRANAIEGLHAAPERLEPYARQGLVDDNRAVRFVACMTIGKFQFANSTHLVEPLLLDEHGSVQAAAIYALFKCGRTTDLNPLAKLLASSEPEVRANAALVLGLLGEASAAPMIKQAVGQGLELANPAQRQIVDLQLAEALVNLGEDEVIHSIRAALFLPPEQAETTALACLILGRVQETGDEGAIASLQQLVLAEGDQRRSAEVRLAALMALSQIGIDGGIPVEMVTEYARHSRDAIRHQVAMTLGEIGTTETLEPLQALLDDPNPLVQVAAATAVLRTGVRLGGG